MSLYGNFLNESGATFGGRASTGINYFDISQEDINENQEMKKFIKLYRAVLMQAVIDATSNSRSVRSKIRKQDAIAWIKNADSDFEEVCSYAGLNAKATQQKLLSYIIRIN